MDIKVVFALREKQWLIHLDVPLGTTLQQALNRSHILDQVPQAVHPELSFGINGRIKPLATELQPGDRVELYRPRTVDPKEARRKRAR